MTATNDYPTSKREARARGLKRYFTGEPCVHGHHAWRNLGGNCAECSTLRNSKEYWERGGREKQQAAYNKRRAAIRKGRNMAMAILGHPAITSQSEARAAGAKTYMTGKVCGGCNQMAPKYTSTRACVVCRHNIYVRRRDAAKGVS